jgi:hypothetical protein
MTAFDTAWELVKMPIDWDSHKVEYDNDNKQNIHTANFYDKRGKLFPMTAWDYDDPFGPGIEVAINHPSEDVTHSIGSADLQREGVENNLTVNSANVDEEHRRQGMNTAMYELMQYIATEKYNQEITESNDQSSDAKAFWAAYRTKQEGGLE